jgi:hypothetical protein
LHTFGDPQVGDSKTVVVDPDATYFGAPLHDE